MNMELSVIRPADAGDIETMIGLLQQLFLIEEDFTFDADRQRRGLELLLENDRSAIMVCEQAGQVIGMASGQLVVSTAEGVFPCSLKMLWFMRPGRTGGLAGSLSEPLAIGPVPMEPGVCNFLPTVTTARGWPFTITPGGAALTWSV